MREIKLSYLYDWSMTNKFDELYHKQICITGKLNSSLMTEDEISYYNDTNGDKWDGMYTKMIDIEDPDNNPKIYIGSSLKILLEKNGYKNYNGPIRVYGIFGIRPTTKTHIGNIWKAEILDENGNIIDTFENKELKPIDL